MELPNDLQRTLEAWTQGLCRRPILDAAREISLRYRDRDRAKGSSLIRSREEALAYAVSRMPATYGAVYTALSQALTAAGNPALATLLDAGAGTGAASWAASALTDVRGIVCLEYEAQMRLLGEALMRNAPAPMDTARWLSCDIARDALPARADLVIASYVFNELPAERRQAAAEKLWAAADRMLLLVESGTPQGFELLRRVRESLPEKGAFLLAPCPHEGPCPMAGNDWCHFSCRVPRSQLHRLAKGGDAPYEDEKFAYLALSRAPAVPQGGRVLRHPKIEKGHIRLELCTASGLRQATYSKKDGEPYHKARKLQWGDTVESCEHSMYDKHSFHE